MRRLVVLAAACVLPFPLLAQTDAPAASAAVAPAAAPAKEKKLCRNEVVSGSYMPHRTCHTKEEWEQIDEVNRQGVEQYSSKKSMGHNPGG